MILTSSFHEFGEFGLKTGIFNFIGKNCDMSLILPHEVTFRFGPELLTYQFRIGLAKFRIGLA